MAFSFSGSSSLVFTHDNFVLRGALVRKGKDKKIEVIAETESMDVNPEQALTDVLEGLQETQKRLPKKAVMASAAMVSAVLELPVDPKKPKPKKQMHELVRWELVEDLGVYNDQWTLGAVAVGRGCMTTAQRLDVVKKMAELRAESAGGRAPRFGDVAISEKYLSSQQHDACLDVQEQLAEPDDDLICDWKPFTQEEEEGKERHFWLCTGMGRFYRNHWARAFKTEGIKLSGFVPLAGLPSGVLGRELKDNSSILFLELLREQVLCFRMDMDDLGRKAVTSLRVESRSNGELDMDMLSDLCLEHVDDKLKKVVISVPFDHDDDGDGDGDDRDVIRSTLETRLDREVVSLAADKGFSGNTAFLAKLGANLLDPKVGAGAFMLQVPAADPPPPVYKNPAFFRYAIPVVLFGAMGANEAYTRFDTNKMQAELDGLKSSTKQTGQLTQAAREAAAKAQQLKSEISSKSVQLNAMKKEIARLQKIFLRSSMPVEVFQILGRTVRNDVMLEKFIEPRNSKTPGFHLHAWAIDELRAESFVDALDRNLIDIGHEVVRRQIFAEKNRYGIQGTGIDLWVVPSSEVSPDKKTKKGKKK